MSLSSPNQLTNQSNINHLISKATPSKINYFLDNPIRYIHCINKMAVTGLCTDKEDKVGG
jgi:hypothetical protein